MKEFIIHFNHFVTIKFAKENICMQIYEQTIKKALTKKFVSA